MLVAQFPEILKQMPNAHLFAAQHCAFARFLQRQPIPKRAMAYLQMHCLVVVMQGEKVIHTAKGDYRIKAGEGLFLKSDNHIFSNIACENGEYEAILLFFDNTEIIRFIHKYRGKLSLELPRKRMDVFHLGANSLLSLIANSFEHYLSGDFQDSSLLIPHKFEELFLFLLSEYQEVFMGFLKSVILEFGFELDMIFDYCSTDFQNVSQMAQYAHMDSATFSRKFKQTFFISPKSWLDEKRFSKAKFYLEHTNKNINQICQECGFSTSWFIERFKKRFHLTPKQYQKSKNLHFSSKNYH